MRVGKCGAQGRRRPCSIKGPKACTRKKENERSRPSLNRASAAGMPGNAHQHVSSVNGRFMRVLEAAIGEKNVEKQSAGVYRPRE